MTQLRLIFDAIFTQFSGVRDVRKSCAWVKTILNQWISAVYILFKIKLKCKRHLATCNIIYWQISVYHFNMEMFNISTVLISKITSSKSCQAFLRFPSDRKQLTSASCCLWEHENCTPYLDKGMKTWQSYLKTPGGHSVYPKKVFIVWCYGWNMHKIVAQIHSDGNAGYLLNVWNVPVYS